MNLNLAFRGLPPLGKRWVLSVFFFLASATLWSQGAYSFDVKLKTNSEMDLPARIVVTVKSVKKRYIRGGETHTRNVQHAFVNVFLGSSQTPMLRTDNLLTKKDGLLALDGDQIDASGKKLVDRYSGTQMYFGRAPSRQTTNTTEASISI